jgi:hypothetical protein
MPLCYSTHLPAITGVYYASHESLQNLKMLEWEITRLRNLRKVTTSQTGLSVPKRTVPYIGPLIRFGSRSILSSANRTYPLTTMQTVTCRQVTNKMVRTMICPPILKIWGGRGVTKFIRCIRPWSHADYCVEERKTSGFYYVISTTKNSRQFPDSDIQS